MGFEDINKLIMNRGTQWDITASPTLGTGLTMLCTNTTILNLETDRNLSLIIDSQTRSFTMISMSTCMGHIVWFAIVQHCLKC